MSEKVVGDPEREKVTPTRKLVIYASGDPLANAWTVRAYDDTTDEHLWSSEGASSLEQGLREVATGIRALAAAFDDPPPACPARSGEKEPPG